MQETRKYGLLMAIAMVIGIVIGSGIFFKADDILVLTGGNVAIGCLVLIIGAGGIIFGGISIAEWAKLTDDAGGLISYGEKAYNKTFAFLIGWFQMVVYFPALVAVICWVGANYTIQLFSNFPMLQSHVWTITIFYIILLYLVNTFSPKIAGYLQTSSMMVKMIPLFLIGIAGLLFGDPSYLQLHSVDGAGIVAGSSAIVAAAFSYDGWSVAPSICHEIKNAKRNLPLALTIAPIMILFVYLLYFLGITFLLGPEKVMELKDGAFEAAASMLAGPFAAKLLLVTVVISVLGTCNGIILGSCRIPHALAIRNEIPFSNKIAKLHERYEVSILSNFTSCIFSFLWLFIHYLTVENPAIQALGMDVSGLPIVIMYIFYFLLYIGVLRYAWKGGIQSKFFGYVCPVLACIGALIVIYGGLSSSNGKMYLIVSILSLASGYLILLYKKKKA
ncbi:amino acid permease [Amedibacterium intestinale]|uniref:APC family permease n=1 Tax=Amedibacterium intestinale TaxID=2583452 RepID=UPI0013738E86|nr:APC family permease [Amedibacterium intestinale]BBK62890.1 amino acid permease [Amedibacterium intestinale]